MKIEDKFLDNLVIELEETIGTSPHSREAIKDILKKAADFGKEKEESVNDDLEEESNKVASELYDEFFPQDGDLITPSDFRNGIKKVARHFANWGKNHKGQVDEDLEEKILNVWEDDPHNKWPKCPYQDFKNIALHFANWQKNQILNNNIADYVVFQKYIGKIGLEAVISKPGYETVWDADKIKIIAIEKDKL